MTESFETASFVVIETRFFNKQRKEVSLCIKVQSRIQRRQHSKSRAV